MNSAGLFEAELSQRSALLCVSQMFQPATHPQSAAECGPDPRRQRLG